MLRVTNVYLSFYCVIDMIPKPYLNIFGGICVILVRQEQVSFRCFAGLQDNHPDDTTGAPVPLDRLSQRSLHERLAFFLSHTILPMSIAKTIDIAGARAGDGIWGLVKRTTEGNVVDLATFMAVNTSNNDSCAIKVLALVAQAVGCQAKGGTGYRALR